MQLFGFGGSPATTQPTSSGHKYRPTTQYTRHGTVYLRSQRLDVHSSATYLSPNNHDHDADYPPLTAPIAPTGTSIAPFQTPRTPPILFYNKNNPYYEFTNFSPDDVTYKGKRYPTSEHLFQSFKFLDNHPEIAERIRTCGERPMLAFDEAHHYQKYVRADWRQVNIEKMEIALRLKFTQHAHLKALLLGTGDAELIEDSPRDYFWGVGADHTGRNELGKALMRLRGEIREERDGPSQIPSVRKDKTRLSVQDLTTLIPTQAAPNMHMLRLNAEVTPPLVTSAFSSSAVRPQIPSAKDKGLCEFCQMRPKFQNHPYCGRTCASEANKMCSFCHSKPRFGQHPYCSRTCAAKASGAV